MGTAVTCGGSSMAMMTAVNSTPDPRNLILASAYAAGTLETSMNAVASTA